MLFKHAFGNSGWEFGNSGCVWCYYLLWFYEINQNMISTIALLYHGICYQLHYICTCLDSPNLSNIKKKNLDFLICDIHKGILTVTVCNFPVIFSKHTQHLVFRRLFMSWSFSWPFPESFLRCSVSYFQGAYQSISLWYALDSFQVSSDWLAVFYWTFLPLFWRDVCFSIRVLPPVLQIFWR